VFFRLRAFLIAVLLMAGPLRLAAESVVQTAQEGWLVRTWQTDEGLPDNNVTGVAQAADGFLWVATLGGLMRFDGAHFEEFSAMHLPHVGYRNVRQMYLDRCGSLWLVMERGAVIRVSQSTARVFGAEDGFTDASVAAITEDVAGGVWMPVGDAFCRIRGEQVDRFGAEEGLPTGGYPWLATDARGQLWFARGSQVGVFREGRWQTLLTLDSSPVRFVAARAGGLWICTATQVLHFTEGGEPRQIARLPRRTKVRAMLEDRTGGLWIGTAADGLLHLRNADLERVEVSQPEISALAEDGEGNLWVGTAGGGLNLVRPRAVGLITTKAGLPFGPARSVCQDAEGWGWAALQDGSLARGRGSQWSVVTRAEGWPGGDARCVATARGGGVWIGTADLGLQRLHAGTARSWGLREGLSSQNVRSLLQATNGDLWIATDTPNRLWLLREEQIHDMKMPDGVRSIRALAEGVDGTIWAGTSGGQVLRVAGRVIVNEVAAQKGLPYSVRCLHTTPDGSLWIGYAGWGVGRWHDGRYARVDATRGLYDDYIWQMLSDGQGGLWLTGNHGLFQVRLEELVNVAEGRSEHLRSIAYGRSEGLPTLQPVCDNSPSACRGQDGQLWFATRNGLLVVHQAKIRDNPRPPPVLLSEVKVDDRLVARLDSKSPLRAPGNSKLTDLRAPGVALQLPPRHSKIEFAFTALSFSSPENVHFRHRLKGFDTEWVEAGPQRSARYPRLSGGQYEFEVTACNESGVWSETGYHLRFVVEPFFWQRWWFRGLLLVTFTAGVVAVVRYVSFRRLRLQMRRLEQQAVLDKERARIAKDLHDDLGASMTQMTLLLELAVQHRPDPDAVIGCVQDGLQAAREAIKSLDAAVWAVNPANNTLPELVAYIGQFAMDFLQQANIRCDLDLPDHPPERPVSAELRHGLFLIVKEALNNVVRHAHASEVRLRIAVTAATLEVLVADNGCGIERKPDDALADGLRNMRQRAEELNAQFQLESTPGTGTRVAVRYPWPRGH